MGPRMHGWGLGCLGGGGTCVVVMVVDKGCVGIHGAGLARDERQVTWVVVGLQTHGGIIHATTLHIPSTWVSGSVC